MAELSRVGGRLESHRRPAGRRVLLPAEADLCNAVGLSEDEYWHFLELADAYTAERPKGYELIPDVRNGPVAPILINLVIGVALSAIGALLAPKPKSPEKQKAPPQLKTEDQQGRSRFAPQSGFDSLQDLAALGAVIPLVFARKSGDVGGVRVNSQLLWSQMMSLGTGQRLNVMALFSSGEVDGKPDFNGYAIGDTLLQNYSESKLALYFREGSTSQIGNRIKRTDRYAEGSLEASDIHDAFAIFWDRDGKDQLYFSGARTPSTQTQFGVFKPMPNGMKHKVGYELVLVLKGSGWQSKNDSRSKQDKINQNFPYRAAITQGDTNLNKGELAVYTLSATGDSGDRFQPWGTQDVVQTVESTLIGADEAISVGEVYMMGSALVACIKESTDEPWRYGRAKEYTFRCLEKGRLATAATNGIAAPYANLTLQRCAVGTVTNTRTCDVTEIGIKSTVWKQINGFSNVNSHPGDETVAKYEEDAGQITLGSMNKYIKRLSFFTLSIRVAGSNASWTNISHDTIFCVQGRTTQPQYNYIRISHKREQYEYKLKPVPGNLAYRNYKGNNVLLLHGGERNQYNSNGFMVAFSGELTQLDDNMMTNPEWVLGGKTYTSDGRVKSVSKTQQGSIPFVTTWVLKETRYEWDDDPRTGNAVRRFQLSSEDSAFYEFHWDFDELGRIEVPDERRGDEPPRYTEGNTQYRVGTQQKDSSRVRRWEIGRYVKEETVETVREKVVVGKGGSGSGLTFRIKTYSNGARSWVIEDRGRGYKTGDQVQVGGSGIFVKVTSDDKDILKDNLNPYDAVADFFMYEAERSSHMDGPEHEIVYVNEQLEMDEPAKYSYLAYAGLRMNSSTEWSSFSNLSAYFKRGVKVERLTKTNTFEASNLLPEIVYGLLTNTLWGAGNLVGSDQVDRDRMKEATRFCQENGFRWDGVLDARQNLREWIFEQAAYCLLDFTVIGGRFSLVPAVPYGTAYKINAGKKVQIKALFTDGNMRSMNVTWLGPEERQLFKAVCLWREENVNGFPQTRVMTMRFADAYGGSDADPEETFDMSGFCTSKDHAKTFARYALKVRKEVDHGIKFETTPQAAMSLAPGDYFRVVSEVTHTDRFNCGSVSPDGFVTSAKPRDRVFDVVYWQPGTTGVKEGTMTVSDSRTTQSAFFGSVFAVKNNTTINRVYKVETLSYADDGLVEISGSYSPLTKTGSLAILDWQWDQFVMENE